MIKDFLQKDMLVRHFAAQNWYYQIETPVFHKGGVHERKKFITDIDVLALRPSADLRWEVVLGDCKTLKGQSPANRVLWLRGLMDYYSATSGIIILQRKQAIEADHKLFASSLGIRIIDEDEFQVYDKAVIYPEGSARYPLAAEDITKLYSLPERYRTLHDFCAYIYADAWNEHNRLELLRRVLGEAISISREIDPAKPEHLALVLDAIGVFSVGLAECVGKIFSQYLQPNSLSLLDEALKIVIWGGRSQYDFAVKVRQELASAKGKQFDQSSSLSLPAWDGFLHLVRTMLDYPQLSFYLPQLMRQAALDTYNNRNFLQYTSNSDLLLLKYAMLVTSYFCKAAKFPTQTRDMLEGKFIRKQSDLVLQKTNMHQLPFLTEDLDAQDVDQPDQQDSAL